MQASQPYREETDEELFALVRAGNESAFEALYRRYDKRVFAYCLSVLRDRPAAEDVFQTIVMTMYEKRHQFKGGNFVGWLFTIARHCCIKASQKRNRLQSAGSAAELTDISVDAYEGDVALQQALDKAIDQLPEKFRKPLELRYFGDLTYEQIAEALGIGLSNAKMRIARARKMVQKTLAPFLEEL